MGNDDTPKSMALDSPLFLALFRVMVPALLGAVLTYAVSISSAQTDQGKQLATVQGQLGIIAQQNSDYLTRLSKLEIIVDENGKLIASLSGRVLVLESARHK